MVDENEHSVSEDRCEGVFLSVPVPDRSDRSSRISHIVESADVHEQKNDNSHPRREDLQAFRVLNITETEDTAKEAEEQDGNFVYPRVVIFECFNVTVREEGDALVKRLSSSDVFETHGTVHVHH